MPVGRVAGGEGPDQTPEGEARSNHLVSCHVDLIIEVDELAAKLQRALLATVHVIVPIDGAPPRREPHGAQALEPPHQDPQRRRSSERRRTHQAEQALVG